MWGQSRLTSAPTQQSVTQTQGEGWTCFFFKELSITLMP